MSSEKLESLEDGLTRVLDELKTMIYHQLPEPRGGISPVCRFDNMNKCYIVERRRQETRAAERLLEDANGYVSTK